jgi:hypothetical protein
MVVALGSLEGRGKSPLAFEKAVGLPIRSKLAVGEDRLCTRQKAKKRFTPPLDFALAEALGLASPGQSLGVFRARQGQVLGKMSRSCVLVSDPKALATMILTYWGPPSAGELIPAPGMAMVTLGPCGGAATGVYDTRWPGMNFS